MRRSRSIRLVLLGATAVTVGACGDDDIAQGQYFASEEQCRQAGEGSACASAFAEAQTNHAIAAPQFGSAQDCEQQYGSGNCETVPPPPAATANPTSPPPPPGSSTTYYGGGMRYRPIMHGFWFDRLGSVGSMGTPVYRDSSFRAVTGRGAVGSFDNRGSFHTVSTRRGGFGRTGFRLFARS